MDAITGNKIHGAFLRGRSTSGKSYSKVLGNQTLPCGTFKPIESSNLIFLPSATKLLTTIATLQCCERRLLSQDADQTKQIPDIAEKGVPLRYDEASGEAIYEPLKKPITLRQMMNLSSGLPYPFLDPQVQKWRDANPPPPLPRSSPQRLAQPLTFPPGEGWMYGVGLDIAGYVVEKVSGMRLDAYTREHLLHPLGIDEKDVSFFPVKEGMADRMPDVNPGDSKGEGKSASAEIRVFEDGETKCFGGHGGYATADAYIAILESILQNDERILRPSSVVEMFKPQLEPATKKAFDAALAGPMGGFFNQSAAESGRDYGLGGIHVTGDGDGAMEKGSLAWGGGLHTVWFVDRTNEVCGFASPQLGLPADGEFALKLEDGFRRGLKGQLEKATDSGGDRGDFAAVDVNSWHSAHMGSVKSGFPSNARRDSKSCQLLHIFASSFCDARRLLAAATPRHRVKLG